MRTTTGKMLLQIHIELFIEFLKMKAIEKYATKDGMRKQYVIDFLHSLQMDINEFIETAHVKTSLKK